MVVATTENHFALYARNATNFTRVKFKTDSNCEFRPLYILRRCIRSCQKHMFFVYKKEKRFYNFYESSAVKEMQQNEVISRNFN
jgi:hypothetical protein